MHRHQNHRTRRYAAVTAGRLAMAVVLAVLCLPHGACRLRDRPATRAPIPPTTSRTGEVGLASYYADQFHGRRTANGERYRKNEYTAAHRRLPFGSRVRVTNLSNDRSVEVRINDRGPYARRRIIDLSRQAASDLGFLEKGVTKVKVEVLERGG